MATIALLSFGFLLLVAVEQGVAVALFVRYCRQASPTSPSDFQPEVLVVLPVRGADDTLAHCVEALARQDYDNYRVRVILDSQTDPGSRVIDQVLLTQPGLPIEVVELREPYPHCSLKCSAVHQATEELDDCEVVALLDSDVVPHTTWLRELVAPLADEAVGAAHGNRWYLPERARWGSLLRYCWNTAAVVTMYFWGMPWGGTMAISRRVLDQSDIRGRWLRAGCEDVPLVSVFRELGLKVRFVPSLVMVDHDETRWGDCLRFLDRQLLWVRLYYGACWWVSNLWQTLIALSIVTAVVCGLGGLFSGKTWLFLAAALVLGVTMGAATFLVWWVERTLLPHEAGPAARRPWKTLLAVTLTNVAMVRVILVSLLTRVVAWRGITYRIAGPWRIEMMEYHPYVDVAPTGAKPKLAGVEAPSYTT
jgi:cellulose synthase/poly-beta-1,6-N-acetylglucosamine synthase-like glycosyltransferase